MLLKLLLILLTCIKTYQALVRCNENVTKLQLCSLHENYNKGLVGTGLEGFEFPLTVNSSITLLDISDFNENRNTISIDLMLSILWFDVSITVESNEPNKYVPLWILFKNMLAH